MSQDNILRKQVEGTNLENEPFFRSQLINPDDHFRMIDRPMEGRETNHDSPRKPDRPLRLRRYQ